MRVEMALTEGRVEIRFRVENAEVRKHMRTEMGELLRSLREAQVSVERFDVSDFNSGGGDESRAAAQRHGGPYGGSQRPALPGEEEAEALRAWTMISDTGRIDCLV